MTAYFKFKVAVCSGLGDEDRHDEIAIDRPGHERVHIGIDKQIGISLAEGESITITCVPVGTAAAEKARKKKP